MIVFTNLSRIVVRSSCLICGADDEIVGTGVKVEGRDGCCDVKCEVFEDDVEDEMFEVFEPANMNFAAS
jgi:hypothetical protein